MDLRTQIRHRLNNLINIGAPMSNNEKIIEALISCGDTTGITAAIAPFFHFPCELGRLALLVSIQRVCLPRFSMAGSAKSPEYIQSLSMTESKGMVEVRRGPITRDSERILKGESSLLCSFLSWKNFPEDLAIQIRDDGSIHAMQKEAHPVTHYLYRVHHDGNELLTIEPAEIPGYMVCNSLGVETTTRVCKTPVSLNTEEVFTWCSDWCIGGHTTDRMTSERISEATGMLSVLSSIVAEYYNLSEYKTINEYRHELSNRIGDLVAKDLAVYGQSVQTVFIIKPYVYGRRKKLVKFNPLSRTVVYRPWMKDTMLPFPVCEKELPGAEKIAIYIYTNHKMNDRSIEMWSRKRKREQRS